MTRRRQFRPPAALTAGILAGILAAALLSGCGEGPGAPGGTPDGTAGGTVDQSPDPTSTEETTEDTPEDSTEDTTDGTRPDDTSTPDDVARPLGPREVLTPDDTGAELRLAPGDEASLHLTPPWQDAVAEVADPTVLELVPVDHFADPGYAEYTLLAHATGETTITVEGPDGERLQFVATVED
ncbi:hypothetical protein [Ornithinimicrobium sufpigmenti]|uniref:hypothetical protein n=1 Tax=Ornithinimicrobium sufpigmenti TaxID=2508882 RepID=UPI0015E1712C|nr:MULTISPECIES: hypothetical protein [unclassified Ornithinimicrobium]